MKNILLMYKILHITHEKMNSLTWAKGHMTNYKTLQQSNIESVKIKVLYSIKSSIFFFLFKSLHTPESISRPLPVFWPEWAGQRGCNQTPGVGPSRTRSAARWVCSCEPGSSSPSCCPGGARLSWRRWTGAARRPGSCWAWWPRGSSTGPSGPALCTRSCTPTDLPGGETTKSVLMRLGCNLLSVWLRFNLYILSFWLHLNSYFKWFPLCLCDTHCSLAATLFCARLHSGPSRCRWSRCLLSRCPCRWCEDL